MVPIGGVGGQGIIEFIKYNDSNYLKLDVLKFEFSQEDVEVNAIIVKNYKIFIN